MVLPYLLFFMFSIIGWIICKQLSIKSPWLRIGFGLIAGVLLTNLTFLLFSKNIGTGMTSTVSQQKFKLLSGAITVSASGNSSGDNGSATVIVTLGRGKRYQLESFFDYDSFNNVDPATVYYSFANFDPIIDLKIKTRNGTYTISGLSGELNK
jgi:hypothetical protein